MLIMPVVAITLWSIDTLGAVQGDVTMKINSSHGLISLGDLKVSPGDRVVFYNKQCTGAKLPVCKLVKAGVGHVTRNLNENYSEIQTDPGVIFHEGYVVKKE